MDKYVLNELFRRIGNKNFICQLLDPGKNISLSEVEETRSYLVAISDDIRYCFTCNPDIADPESEYVILTDRRPLFTKYIQ